MANSNDVHESVKKYYGTRLEHSDDLQTNASSCGYSGSPMPKSVREALSLIHPEVSKKYFGCGLPFPTKLGGCRVLDLGSGSGRDCFAFSKLVGESGHVIGIDMTEELVAVSRQYAEYHQKTFGYKEANVSFVQGYMEKLNEAGIQDNTIDAVISNCVVCLCPDKRDVLQQAYNVLKEGGELYFSDMYASKVIPDHMRKDPVLWGEGMGGSLYWRELIDLAHGVGFSTPSLVSSSAIVVHDPELKEKAGDIRYASCTYRMFKLPKATARHGATVTYKGTMAEFPNQLDFDSVHSFKKDEAVKVGGEMAAILQSSRFSTDFIIQPSNEPEPKPEAAPQYCHLDPFQLADRLGHSIKQCSKTPQKCCA